MSPDFPNTRWSLIARLMNESGGHVTLIELYVPGIERYLTQKFPVDHQRGTLDDIIQEVLIDLIERPSLFAHAQPNTGSRFRYVVMNAAYLLALNARRRVQRMVQQSEIHETISTSHVPAEAVAAMDRAWAESVMAAAWNEVAAWTKEGVLEPVTMTLLDEHLIRGVALREVAERVGLPLTTCFRHLAKGRMYLQKAISDRLIRAGEITEGTASAACEHMLGILQRRDESLR